MKHSAPGWRIWRESQVFMNCPLEASENAQVLLDYGMRKLDAQRTAILEAHLEICPSCREFAVGQRALWEALDQFEAAPVSRDFDRRLFARIDREVSFWDLLVRPFRPLMAPSALPAAAAACLLVVAGVLVERPAAPPATPARDMAQMESIQPEQVEQALDAMEMLNEFSRNVRSEKPDSKL
jgi:hypothetical protein